MKIRIEQLALSTTAISAILLIFACFTLSVSPAHWHHDHAASSPNGGEETHPHEAAQASHSHHHSEDDHADGADSHTHSIDGNSAAHTHRPQSYRVNIPSAKSLALQILVPLCHDDSPTDLHLDQKVLAGETDRSSPAERAPPIHI